MPTLGTKKFWKPAIGFPADQSKNQVLKNKGYFSIQLLSANYKSNGNFWQRTFGGTDNIVLSTTLKYQSGVSSIEALAIQDVSEVKADRSHHLGLQKNIAVKIPATIDSITLSVKMTSAKNDKLQEKFDLLNSEEYQEGLELAPKVVGKVLTITSLAKKLFTETDPKKELDASFATIISDKPTPEPVKNGRLTRGLLIMVSTDEEESYDNIDEGLFEIKELELYYDGKQVLNTYLIFLVSFELTKGLDENSAWSNRFDEADNHLENILKTFDKNKQKEIWEEAVSIWQEGATLLNEDATYINAEKVEIKNSKLEKMREKFSKVYNSSTGVESTISPKQLQHIIGGEKDISVLEDALPNTVGLIKNLALDGPDTNRIEDALMTVDNLALTEALRHDSEHYQSKLLGSK